MSRCGRNYRGEDEDDQRAQRYAGASKHGGLQTIMIVGGRTEAAIAQCPPGRVTGSPTIPVNLDMRSEEHTSELQSLMRISYAVFCLKKTLPSIQPSFRI